MPPSGPSALWSSNNSIQNTTTAVPAQDHHNGIMMNNNRGGGGGHHDVIGSLGKVLSNVNLAGGGGGEYSDNSGHGSVGGGGGGGQPSSQQGGGYGAPGTAVGSHPGSWSGLSASAAPAPAPAGLSYNFYNNNNNGSSNQPTNNVPIKNSSTTTTNNNEPHDSLQNILYDSGIYEKEEVAVHRRASATGGSSPLSTSDHNNHRRPSERKPSIDIFLSQSPSKALGEDAFRVMNRTASNPSLVGLNYPNQHGDNNGMASNNNNNNNVGLGGKPLASTAPSSRSESPQNLVRAGSSNGSSPYGGGSGTTNANNARQMYPSQFTATAQTFSPSGVGNTTTQQHHQQHGGGSSQLHAQLQQQPSLSSQYSSSSNNIPGLINGQQQQQQQPQHHQPQQQQQQQQPVQQQQYMPMPVSQQQQQQQQPQVFYMAVAGPDGKQVLQPVQMVQMPGQAGTLMMPVAAASAAPPTGNTQGQDGQMMLMQPAAAGQAQQQGSSNGMNTMYGGGQQDNQGVGGGGGIVGSSNNQYSQYGQQQQSGVGGYDTMNGNHHHHHRGGYQSKNAVDNANLIGGNNHYQPNNNDQGGNNNNILVGGAGGVIVDPSQVPAGSLSMLYSSPQRPPLRALLGNVRRLSRDQVGCRLLQQALDEDGPSAATAILNEGLTFWAEAMVDPFGNYLFQKILERITPEERVTLVSSVSTRLVNASLNLHGTRSVQKIVEVCAVDEEENEENEEFAQQDGGGINKEVEENKKLEEEEESKANKSNKKGKKKKETAAKILTDALKPSAARLCIDSHGNHAIQRILLKLPYQYTQFIFDAVAASVEDVARHRHGCCVIQRCLDSRHSAARTHLVSRIVEKSLELMQDAYGNYVVQYVLDVCGDDEVHAICESVIGKVCLLAIQKFSSNVMEKCLERCTDRVREEYLNELNDSDRIRELMMDPFGNYVVQRALSVSTHAQAIRLVETMKPHLSSQNGGGIRNTAGGRRILGKICRRFPNFVLEGETFEDYDLNQVLARGSPHHHHNNPPGVGGGGGRRQNQFGMNPHNPGPSPNHRRNNRGRGNQHHHQHQQHTIPQYQQPQVGHHVNVQQPDMSVMQPAYHHQATGAHPYLFPHSM